MYGYEPPRDPNKEGTWGEVFAFSLVALQVILPWLGFVLAGMLLVALALYFITVNAWLTLIPLSIIVSTVVVVYRRERREQREIAVRLGVSDDPPK